MTPLERAAVSCLHYKNYRTLAEMPLCVVTQVAFGHELTSRMERETADVYRATLEGMLAKGWLRVVKKTPEERLAKLREAGWIGPHPGLVPQKGDLDFTRKGFALYRRVSRASGTMLSESLLYVDETARVAQIVASTKAECLRAFQKYMGNAPEYYATYLASYVGGPIRVFRVEKPKRVGRWMEREVSPRRGGWRIQVHYRRGRWYRVKLPELGVIGSRLTMYQTTITGKVRPVGARKTYPFELSEIKDYDGAGTEFFRPCLTICDGETTQESITTVYKGESVQLGGTVEGGFEWRGSTGLPQPMTPEQALATLREGILAWRSHRSRG